MRKVYIYTLPTFHNSPSTEHQPPNTNLGQSLFEVVVAIGMIALVLVAIVSVSTASVRNSSFARNNAVATKYAQEGSEWLRAQRDYNWDTFRSNVQGHSCFGGLSWGSGCSIDGVFSRRISSKTCHKFNPPSTTTNVSCSNDEANMIDIVVSVTWTDSQGEHKVDSATTYSRWR